MFRKRFSTARLVFVLLGLALSGCGSSDGPTAPGPQPPPPAPAQERPVITGVSPSAPIAGPGEQPVIVTGSNFAPGASVSLTRPDGSVTTFGPDRIRDASATSLTVLAEITAAGDHRLHVTNPGGQRSNEYRFSAAARPQEGDVATGTTNTAGEVIVNVPVVGPVPVRVVNETGQALANASVVATGGGVAAFAEGYDATIVLTPRTTIAASALTGDGILVTLRRWTCKVQELADSCLGADLLGRASSACGVADVLDRGVFSCGSGPNLHGDNIVAQALVLNAGSIVQKLLERIPLVGCGLTILSEGSGFDLNSAYLNLTAKWYPELQGSTFLVVNYLGKDVYTPFVCPKPTLPRHSGSTQGSTWNGTLSWTVPNELLKQERVAGWKGETCQAGNPAFDLPAPSVSPVAVLSSLPTSRAVPSVNRSVSLSIPAGTYSWQVHTTRLDNSVESSPCQRLNAGGSAPPQPPGNAGNPVPGQNAAAVSTATTLSWTAAPHATGYDVYFGSSLPSVPTFTTAGTSYTPPAMTPGTTYRWRVDAKNAVGTTVGDVWTFTTVAAPQPRPVVHSITPNPVPAVDADQPVRVSGSAFQPGLVVDVFNSAGARIATLTGTQVQSVTTSAFTMLVNLGSSPGTFAFEAVNPDGGRSQRFTFSTAAAPRVAPFVSSISPSPVPVFNGNQDVRVFGGNFAAGLTVDVFNSSGTRIGTLSGTQVKSVTMSSFTMVVSLGSTPGSFGMEVVNPDGGRSTRFTFSTQATSPAVASISPNPVPTFNADQAVQVKGSNFQSGLVVDVYNSDGARIATLSGTQIVNVNASGFTMLMNLGATASSFAIEVVNPDGRRSSRFSFSTTAQSPNVSSLNPNPVPVFNGNQDVRVSGSHFQFNLTVDVYNSSGTKIGTLSGTQIKNVTATSFTMVLHLGSTPGNFALEVVNPSGARSTRFAFTTR